MEPKNSFGKRVVNKLRSIFCRIGGKLRRASFARRDRRFGGLAATATIPSRFAELGACDTQSSDYRCLEAVFRDEPLRADDRFVDVGCGEGRVLTYLYSLGFRGPAVGIELDPDVAQTARARTACCENVTILCGNVLEQAEVFADATAVYMFNPFARCIVREFSDMLCAVCTKPVRLYYLNDFFGDEFAKNDRWRCVREAVIERRGSRPMHYAVYALLAAEAVDKPADSGIMKVSKP